MDITVTPAGGAGGESETQPAATPPPPVPVPAAPGSPLINLRAIRQAKLAKLHLDLPVPRWDEEGGPDPVVLVVRYRPVDSTAAINAVEKRQRSKADDWVVLSQIDQLVDSCVGVYAKRDGKRFTLAPSGEWVEFDPDTAAPHEWVGFSGERAPDLAAALGLDLTNEPSKAAALVRAVYFTDGDIGLACQQLAAFSTKMGPQADEEALGE